MKLYEFLKLEDIDLDVAIWLCENEREFFLHAFLTFRAERHYAPAGIEINVEKIIDEFKRLELLDEDHDGQVPPEEG